MPSHLIRLRGGWEWRDAAPGSPGPRRMNLPASWPAGLPARGTLTRRFGRPPSDPVSEQVLLVIDAAAGLASVMLNGFLLDLDAGPAAPREWPVGPILAARNELVLGLDLDLDESAGPWGVVALRVDAV